MNDRNDRFNRTFLSLDRLAETVDIGKSPFVSDRGEFARDLADYMDIPPAAAEREQVARDDERARRLAAAIARLRTSGKAKLIPVLELIVENGNDRTASIAAIARTEGLCMSSARKRYERARAELLEFFAVV